MKEHLLGGIDPGFFAACFIAALVGMTITLLGGTLLRDPNSDSSPKFFSWKYLWSDNLKRILFAILLILSSLRFLPELFNTELTMWGAFSAGIGWDGLLLIIKQKTNWIDPSAK